MNKESRVLNITVIALMIVAIAVIWLMVSTMPAWISVGVIASMLLIIIFLVGIWFVSH